MTADASLLQRSTADAEFLAARPADEPEPMIEWRSDAAREDSWHM